MGINDYYGNTTSVTYSTSSTSDFYGTGDPIYAPYVSSRTQFMLVMNVYLFETCNWHALNSEDLVIHLRHVKEHPEKYERNKKAGQRLRTEAIKFLNKHEEVLGKECQIKLEGDSSW